MPAPRPATRLAVATSADYPAIQPDDAGVAAALERRGIGSAVCVWNDPTVDWAAFDAVLIRTIWDYFKHYEAFLAWLDQLDRLGVRTINDSAVLRWNSDKRYLLELAQHAVAIIPTRIASASQLHDVLTSMPGQQVVVKPSVSGGAWHTVRGRVGDTDFAAAVARLPAAFDYLVQPFVPEILSDGEWSLLYFSGEFSHAVIKRPALGDYRVQSEYGGSIESIQPSASTLAAAEQALAAVAALGYGKLVYARVDGVISEGRFLIMELELIEPFLFLAAQPQAPERFAAQLTERIEMPPATTEHLFSYGTLQTDAVQLATFGRLLVGQPDTLPGYRREMIRITDPQVVSTSGESHHPIVYPTGLAADAVAGSVFRITAQELAHADAYEVDDYQRIAVMLASGIKAWVYVRAAQG